MTAFDCLGFGHRLHALRTEHHLTQEKLAEKIDVSFQFIGLLERGQRVPSIDTILKLCDALDCTPDVLLADSLPGRNVCILRDAGASVLRNTLTDWLLDNSDVLDEPKPADLSALPPLGFMAIDEEFPPSR